MLEPKSIGVITPDSHVTGVRFSPCGRILAAPGFDQAIHRWDLNGIEKPGEKEFSIPEMPKVGGHNGYVSAVEFHPSRLIAFSADSWGRLKAWPYLSENPEPLWDLPEAHDGWLRDIAVGGEGDWLATCGRDQKVRFFNTTDGQLLGEIAGHEDDIFAVAVHPSGKWVVSGDLRGRIVQWSIESGKIVREFDASEFHLLHRLQDIAGLRKLVFSADGKTLIVAGGIPTGGGNVRGLGHVKIFDFESGEVKHDMAIGEEPKDVFAHDVALHPDGFLIAVTTGQAGSGKLILQHPGEAEPFFVSSKGTVNCHGVDLSADGKRIAVSATNSGSNGNGRRLDKDGKYGNNHSPIHLFELAEVETEPEKKA